MRNKMIKGVIFDMDGVLVNSELVYRDHLYGFLKSIDIDVEISELNFLAGSSGKVETDYLTKKLNKTIEEISQLKDTYFKAITIDYEKIKKPFVNELLDYLVSNNIKIGLASSSKMENIKHVLEECKIKDYFNSVVSGEMFLESKPNPEIYNYTVSSMELEKEELLVIEDSNYGVLAGKAAGLKVAAVIDPIFKFDVQSADYKIETLKDVIQIIETYERQQL
jgi:HAD superfamily hydrolase (TIGR01509 family)